MALCTERSFVNADYLSGEIRGLRCKKWDCEICRPYNRMKVMNAAKNGRPNLFLTLTCDSKRYATPAEAAADMKRGLVLLRRRIERRWNVKNLPFIVVFEATKKGWPHMHLLLRAPFMHWKVLRAMWREITGAFEVDVRFIRKASQVLFYVTKYIGKDLCAFPGCKRWWRSHNYAEIKDDPPALKSRGLMFQRIDGEYFDIKEKAEKAGWIVEITDKHSMEIRPDWTRERRRWDGAFWVMLAGQGGSVA